jgi:hypothetical protein
LQLVSDDRSGRVLVVHPDRKAQRTLQRILAATLRPVECVEAEVAAARAAEHPGTLVVIDIAVAKQRPDLARAAGPTWIAVPGDETVAAKPDDVAALLEAGWRHVLGVPMGMCHDELAATAQKLLRRDVFGLEKYVGWSAAVRTVTIDDALDRPAAVGALVAGVSDAGLSERVASLASVIADELLANAVYDAPVDAGGGRPMRAAPRDQSRPLDARAAVTLRWACDARLLAVEVTDRWGSLDPALPGPLIARSARRAGRAGGSGAIASAEDGGGMGLALAYACCHQLAISVAPGVRTEVTALLDVRHRPADLGRAPSFHVFSGESP